MAGLSTFRCVCGVQTCRIDPVSSPADLALSASLGIAIMNSAPLRLSPTLISPPCASMTRLIIDRSSTVPLDLVVKNGLNTLLRCADVSLGPLSDTTRRITGRLVRGTYEQRTSASTGCLPFSEALATPWISAWQLPRFPLARISLPNWKDQVMRRRQFIHAVLPIVALAAASSCFGQQQRGENAALSHGIPTSSFRECAKANADCQRECDSCALHCAEMLARGHQDHYTTLRACLDCADLCSAAAKIMSRSGPFSAEICDACAEACRRCGDACKQHPDDPRMKDCAEHCQHCEKSCREMARTARQTPNLQPR